MMQSPPVKKLDGFVKKVHAENLSRRVSVNLYRSKKPLFKKIVATRHGSGT